MYVTIETIYWNRDAGKVKNIWCSVSFFCFSSALHTCFIPQSAWSKFTDEFVCLSVCLLPTLVTENLQTSTEDRMAPGCTVQAYGDLEYNWTAIIVMYIQLGLCQNKQLGPNMVLPYFKHWGKAKPNIGNHKAEDKNA